MASRTTRQDVRSFLAGGTQNQGLRSVGEGLQDLGTALGTKGSFSGLQRERKARKRADVLGAQVDRSNEIKATQLERQEKFNVDFENSPIVQGVKHFTLNKDKAGALGLFNRDRKEDEKWIDFDVAKNGDLTLKDAKGDVVKVPVQNFVNGLFASSPVDAIRNIVKGGGRGPSQLDLDRESRLTKQGAAAQASREDTEKRLQGAAAKRAADKIQGDIDDLMDTITSDISPDDLSSPNITRINANLRRAEKKAPNEQVRQAVRANFASSLSDGIAQAQNVLSEDQLAASKAQDRLFKAENAKSKDAGRIEDLQEIAKNKDEIVSKQQRILRTLQQRLSKHNDRAKTQDELVTELAEATPVDTSPPDATVAAAGEADPVTQGILQMVQDGKISQSEATNIIQRIEGGEGSGVSVQEGGDEEAIQLPATAEERAALPSGTLVRDPATGRLFRKK